MSISDPSCSTPSKVGKNELNDSPCEGKSPLSSESFVTTSSQGLEVQEQEALKPLQRPKEESSDVPIDCERKQITPEVQRTVLGLKTEIIENAMPSVSDELQSKNKVSVSDGAVQVEPQTIAKATQSEINVLNKEVQYDSQISVQSQGIQTVNNVVSKAVQCNNEVFSRGVQCSLQSWRSQGTQTHRQEFLTSRACQTEDVEYPTGINTNPTAANQENIITSEDGHSPCLLHSRHSNSPSKQLHSCLKHPQRTNQGEPAAVASTSKQSLHSPSKTATTSHVAKGQKNFLSKKRSYAKHKAINSPKKNQKEKDQAVQCAEETIQKENTIYSPFSEEEFLTCPQSSPGSIEGPQTQQSPELNTQFYSMACERNSSPESLEDLVDELEHSKNQASSVEKTETTSKEKKKTLFSASRNLEITYNSENEEDIGDSRTLSSRKSTKGKISDQGVQKGSTCRVRNVSSDSEVQVGDFRRSSSRMSAISEQRPGERDRQRKRKVTSGLEDEDRAERRASESEESDQSLIVLRHLPSKILKEKQQKMCRKSSALIHKSSSSDSNMESIVPETPQNTSINKRFSGVKCSVEMKKSLVSCEDEDVDSSTETVIANVNNQPKIICNASSSGQASLQNRSCNNNAATLNKPNNSDLGESTSSSDMSLKEEEEMVKVLTSANKGERRKIVSVWSSDSESEEDARVLENKHKKHKRLSYTEEERLAIVNYIVSRQVYSQVGGRAMWEKMERAKVCANRTWQSMKEHFRKQILPRIRTYDLPKHVKERFLALRR